MNEEPPKCFLGCCDVRSWTLAVPKINFVLLTISLIGDISWITRSPEAIIPRLIIHIFLLYVNAKLSEGVIEHDIAPIRQWLLVYLVLFVVLSFTMIVGVLMISTGGFQNTEYERLKENVPLIVIMCIITEGIIILWNYPVYQLYIYEKTCLQRTGASP